MSKFREMSYEERLDYINALAQEKDVSVIREALEANPEILCYDNPFNGERFLHKAVVAGNIPAISLVVNTPEFKPYISEKQMLWAMIYASYEKNDEAGVVLIKSLGKGEESWIEFSEAYLRSCEESKLEDEISAFYQEFNDCILNATFLELGAIYDGLSPENTQSTLAGLVESA